jgi:hypothetical protein
MRAPHTGSLSVNTGGASGPVIARHDKGRCCDRPNPFRATNGEAFGWLTLLPHLKARTSAPARRRTDLTNNHIWFLNREDGRVVGQMGNMGENGGQFFALHMIAVDSKGNILLVGRKHHAPGGTAHARRWGQDEFLRRRLRGLPNCAESEG